MSRHPVHLLEDAADAYSVARRSSKRADGVAKNYITGRRGERAQELAAIARARKLAASDRLMSAALAYAAWSKLNEERA